jgi:hypothetical protein
VSPRAREDSVRPRLQSGACVRPLNFTVRRTPMASLKVVRDLWHNTHEMPWLVRMLCQGAMTAAPILGAVTLVPGIDWNVDGRDMTYREVWSSGVGASILVSMLLVTIGGWGAAARAPNSRWALVLFPVIMAAPMALVRGAPGGSSPGVVLGSVCITAAVLYVCLFRLSSVRRYFEEGPSNNRWRGP